MAVGLQCFNSSGVTTLDYTTVTGKILGSVYIDSAGGFSAVQLTGGRLFYSFYPSNSPAGYWEDRYPIFTLNSTTLTWKYPEGAGGKAVGQLTYGYA